ncbi:MAG: hypothetical protein K6T88_13325 [Bacillus sp. (in: Bacteria)]|nr:hypothetical protein [Bacillus sp. (in: firmicutes)]
MDSKEKSLIKYYYEKLLDNSFDEKSVYAFLMLIRNRSNGNKCMNELADFVNDRDKYKGFIKEYLLETAHKFDNLGKSNTTIKIEDVFSFREIKQGINQVLTSCQLKGLENEKINDFITCVISILQHVKIMENGRAIGKVFFAMASKQILLMAEVEIGQKGRKKTNAVFPVLTANNNYLTIKKQDKYDAPYFFEEEVIEIVNEDGKLAITILGSDTQTAKV